MSYFHHCKICNLVLSDTRNALSLHIRMHNISKEEYYCKYMDSRTTCIDCNVPVRFLNLQSGYTERCKSCAVKTQWVGERGKERKKLFSVLLIERGPSSLGGAGKRKGVKNIKPYPKTEAVQKRYEQQRGRPAPHNRNPEKIEKQKNAWAAKSDEEMRLIMSKMAASRSEPMTDLKRRKLDAEIEHWLEFGDKTSLLTKLGIL